MKIIKHLGVFLAGMLSPSVHGAELFTASIGLGSEQSTSIRISWQHELGQLWQQSLDSRLGLRWDLALMQLHSDHQHLNILSASPVFSYRFPLQNRSYEPYLEGGIGAALLSDNQYGKRELGSHWLFEDRLGIGIRFGGRHDLNFSYLHHSNANLARDNDGLNTYMLSYAVAF